MNMFSPNIAYVVVKTYIDIYEKNNAVLGKKISSYCAATKEFVLKFMTKQNLFSQELSKITITREKKSTSSLSLSLSLNTYLLNLS